MHSRPGSPNVVYIDFDGATISGTAWNGTHAQLDALAYNVEGDRSSFSALERTRIVDIWHRVAEDLAPYDIDVTTERPAVFNSTTGTILVTHSIDANGNAINCTSCGGVAYVNVFGRSNYHTYYSPALVFYDKLGGGGETYVAEASSHEFGHNLGLSHDGTTTGSTYYGGHGSGLVSWASIMGNSYNNNVTEWSRGEYANANQTQDDLAIIEGKLGYLPDDHGDTRGSATSLFIGAGGAVVSSNPELDPHNALTENKGVIGSADDVDVFSFVAGAGTVNLTVKPAWDAFYRSTSRRGANLDVEAELQDLSGATGTLNDPSNDTGAVINTTVSAGTYYLLVTGDAKCSTAGSGWQSGRSYIATGLTAGTTYTFQTMARDQAGNETGRSPSASATTASPPQPSLNLAASGSKVKGQQLVSLSWTGSSSVTVYRDGSLVTTVSVGSYDDNLGKGGGTYTHKVCDTNSGACSNETTTTL